MINNWGGRGVVVVTPGERLFGQIIINFGGREREERDNERVDGEVSKYDTYHMLCTSWYSNAIIIIQRYMYSTLISIPNFKYLAHLFILLKLNKGYC